MSIHAQAHPPSSSVSGWIRVGTFNGNFSARPGIPPTVTSRSSTTLVLVLALWIGATPKRHHHTWRVALDITQHVMCWGATLRSVSEMDV